MKFGLGPYPAAEQGRDESVAHGRLLEDAVLAEEEGFDSLWIGPGDQLSGASPFALGAAAARRTSALRIVVRAPLGLTHPLYAAEDAVALDLLSAGRAVLAPAERPSDEALAAYRLDAASAVERMWESVAVLHQAWAPGPFGHQGVHWAIPARLPEHTEAKDNGELNVTPKPAQPLIPVWVAPASAAGARRAAAFGLAIVAEPSASLDEVERLLLAHAETAPPVARALRIAIRDVHVGDSDDEARRAVGAVDPERALVGGVDAVVAALERYAAVGVNYVVCRMALPGLSVEQVRGSMVRFSRAVAPRMRMVGFPEGIRVRTLAEAADPMIGYLKEEQLA